LAQVTEQYIQILNQSAKQSINTSELADFLVVAARLLLIKSRALLPFLDWGDDDADAEEDLTRQLKIYKQYLDASKVIQGLITQKRFTFSRTKLLTQQEVEFSPSPELTKSKLAKAFNQVIKALDPLANLPTEIVQKTINIQEKIKQIREKILRQASTNFTEVLNQAKDKTEIIVSFLALLELIKQKTIAVQQNNIFEDIKIERLKSK
jgi:segregation and condensation protein A